MDAPSDPPSPPTPPIAQPPLPQQRVTTLPPPPRPSGCGCFAMGCMSFVVIGLFALIVILGCSWFFYVKAVNAFTAAEPADVAITMATDAEFGAANAKLNQFKDALHHNRGTTTVFNAAELNALIARHPDFASRKGKMRLAIADSVATIEMSVPLDELQLPRVKHRWFNGSTRVSFEYADDEFDFEPEWIEANGHHLSGGLLRALSSSFNQGFTKSFDESLQKSGGSAFWKNVKTMKLDHDQLIITTRGPEAPSA